MTFKDSNILFRNFWLIVFLASSLTFVAQTKSFNIQTIDGKRYYIHKIEKGQSLYAISKLYNVSLDEIYSVNPEVKGGTKANQEIKIPIKEETAVRTETAAPVGVTDPTAIDTNLYYVHKVQKKETLYSIGRKFKISEAELKILNPSVITGGLKEGDVIIVGEKRKPAVKNLTISGIVKADSLRPGIIQRTKKAEYNISLLLPFRLEESLNIETATLAKSKSNFPVVPSLAVDFYLGFKRAVDSLATDSFKLNLNLYDIDDNDSAKVMQMAKDPGFKQTDIIFGPLHASGFKILSQKAKDAGIPIISPLTQQNKMLYNNIYSSKTNPSQFTLMESLADYCLDSLMNSGTTIMLVQLSTSDSKEITYIKAFKKYYNEKLKIYGRPLKDTIPVIKGLARVKNAFNHNGKNVIVTLSTNQVLITDFTTQLAVFSSKKDVTLCGWQNIAAIDNLDQEYLNEMHFTFPYQYNITNAQSYENVIAYYRDRQSTYPRDEFFIGFDIAFYYLKNLKEHGPGFVFNLNMLPAETNFMRFKFTRPDNVTGFDNRGVYIFRYNEYQIQKTGWK